MTQREIVEEARRIRRMADHISRIAKKVEHQPDRFVPGRCVDMVSEARVMVSRLELILTDEAFNRMSAR